MKRHQKHILGKVTVSTKIRTEKKKTKIPQCFVDQLADSISPTTLKENPSPVKTSDNNSDTESDDGRT